MDKKGQGLSLNTIIIAIIVLVVLVVLIMVFTGVLGNFTGEVSSCQNNGGVCLDRTGDDPPCGRDAFKNPIKERTVGTCSDGKICCDSFFDSVTASQDDNGKLGEGRPCGSPADNRCADGLICICPRDADTACQGPNAINRVCTKPSN